MRRSIADIWSRSERILTSGVMHQRCGHGLAGRGSRGCPGRARRVTEISDSLKITPPSTGLNWHSDGPSRSTLVITSDLATATCTAAATLMLVSSMQPIMHSMPYMPAMSAMRIALEMPPVFISLMLMMSAARMRISSITSVGPEHALVGHDRRVHALGDVAHAFQVLRLHRLLDQFQLDAGVLQRLQRVHRLLRGPALVRIQPQQRAAFDRGIDRLDALDVDADVLADLDLQRLEAAFHRRDRVGDHLVDVVDADRDVGGDHRIAAAQQLVQRRVVQLARTGRTPRSPPPPWRWSSSPSRPGSAG